MHRIILMQIFDTSQAIQGRQRQGRIQQSVKKRTLSDIPKQGAFVAIAAQGIDDNVQLFFQKQEQM